MRPRRKIRVKAIRFARNYGFRSILLNFLQAQGDAVMQVDADLQDRLRCCRSFWSTGNGDI